MNKLGPLSRALALAGLIVASFAAPVVPALAQSEAAVLQEYIGEYRGRGVFEGSQNETVVCRLALTPGNEDKVNYRGRCAVAGTNLSINGTLAYINNRYEAAITSNAQFSGTAVGRRQNNGVVFNFNQTGQDENGQEMRLSADFTLTGGQISVRFNVQTADGTYRATVPFTR